MGKDYILKADIIKELEAVTLQRDQLMQRLEGDTPYKVTIRRLQTLESLYHRSQRQFNAVRLVADNTQVLLDEERIDSQVLLKIQDQLLTMLGGKVWICPSCGKVAAGNDGPHLVMCADCTT